MKNVQHTTPWLGIENQVARRAAGLLLLVLLPNYLACTPSCTIDADGNGTITADELNAFGATLGAGSALDFGSLVGLAGCASYLDQLTEFGQGLPGPADQLLEAVDQQPEPEDQMPVPVDQQPEPVDQPMNPLSGWWRFSTNNGGSKCSDTSIGAFVWEPKTWYFRFDDQGALVEVQPPGKQDPNDPEEVVLQWEGVEFTGAISDTAVSIRVRGHVFEPRWQNIEQLQHEQSYFNPPTTVASLSEAERNDLVQNVGCFWAYEVEFTSVPGVAREGPAFTDRTRQEAKPLIICNSEGCQISDFYQEPPDGYTGSRLFTTLAKSHEAPPGSR